ncbi:MULTISPECIES: DUF4238 domain-containing protein [unclassified Mesorhizobium]|uniref:DUF4238 domain-containing protein n=1 Tax=unclassified Mesorhizobium TaxID=325217 RepID=UPI00333BD7F5
MDHHFLPQFHLRQWANSEGLVTRWGRIPSSGKLTKRSLHPAATAYSPGLYALKGVSDAKVDAIEEHVLGDIDNRAAPILNQLIEKGVRSLSARQRYYWARYLNASAARIPYVVAEANSKASSVLERMLSEPDPGLEWVHNDASGPLFNGGIVALAKFFSYKKPIDRFLSLRWSVRNVSNSKLPLMIGDDPLGRTGNLYEADCLVTLPLSPNHVFLATDSPRVINAINRRHDQQLVELVNQQSLSDAKQFAYGDADLNMVDQWLITALKKA